jgi:hypothetical protein
MIVQPLKVAMYFCRFTQRRPCNRAEIYEDFREVKNASPVHFGGSPTNQPSGFSAKITSEHPTIRELSRAGWQPPAVRELA